MATNIADIDGEIRYSYHHHKDSCYQNVTCQITYITRSSGNRESKLEHHSEGCEPDREVDYKWLDRDDRYTVPVRSRSHQISKINCGYTEGGIESATILYKKKR